MSICDNTPWIWVRKPLGADVDFHGIHALQDRMTRLFEEAFAGSQLTASGELFADGSLRAPRMDVSQNDKEYRFTAELPGVEDNDVEVTLTNGVLTIKGEKKSERKEKKDHFLRTERSYGAFERSFSLPADVDEDNIEASFDKGGS